MERRRTRRNLFVGGALAAILVLGSVATAQSKPRLNALLVGGLDHQEVFEALIPTCEQLLGIDVEWSALPRDQLVVRATTLGLARSDSIDVYSTHYSTIPEFYEFLQPLQSYFSSEDLADFSSASMDFGYINGDLYQIPRLIDARMLFYRTDMFQEAGLTPPTNWQELLEVSQALNNPNDGVYGFIGVGKGNAVMRHFSDFLWQAGGDFLDEDMHPTFNGPAGVEALQFLVDMIYKYEVVPPGSVSFGWTEARTMFAQGGGAMLYDWPSAPPLLDDPERSQIVGEYAFAPVPGFRTNISTAVAHGFGVNRFSSQKELAADFIGCMTAPEQQYVEYSLRGTFPARNSVVERIINEATDIERARLVALQGVADTGKSWPAIPEMSEIERTIYDELERALIRTKSPQQALDDAAKQVEAILSEAGYYN